MQVAREEGERMINFFIPGEFITLNDYINAERSNKFQAANIKKAETARVILECKSGDVPKVTRYPVKIGFHWYTSNRRSDPDNIAFAAKFILDGMVKAKILKDDGQEEIQSFNHNYSLDKNNPGVAVTIWQGEV